MGGGTHDIYVPPVDAHVWRQLHLSAVARCSDSYCILLGYHAEHVPAISSAWNIFFKFRRRGRDRTKWRKLLSLCHTLGSASRSPYLPCHQVDKWRTSELEQNNNGISWKRNWERRWFQLSNSLLYGILYTATSRPNTNTLTITLYVNSRASFHFGQHVIHQTLK